MTATHMKTAENAGNLARPFLDAMEKRYGGTRLGRQELDGELIEEIEVHIGAMRQIVPEALEMGFRAAAEGTLAANARLNIIEEKIAAVCRGCETRFMPDIDNYLCPQCGQADARIVAGNDIILRSVVCQTPEEADDKTQEANT